MSELTHLSLFSGVGGLDISAQWAGFTTVGFCEWADYPHSIMSKRFPQAARWRDIRTLTKESFYAETGRRTVDLLSGGFPCQPFSLAGKRGGTTDDRYLWPEMLRVVDELRPTFVIGENVAGLLTMAEPIGDITVESRNTPIDADCDAREVYTQEERYILAGILQDLERIGYQVQLFVFPACAANAPHRRDRVCIIAYTDHTQTA